MEVKPAEFARMAGVTRQSINGKIKNKMLVVNAAGFLDTENPLNAAYLSKHGRGGGFGQGFGYGPPVAPPQVGAGALSGGNEPPAPGAGFSSAGNGGGTDELLSKAAGVPARLLGLTLRELMTSYGGNLQNLEKHAKILRDLTMASEKEQRIQERRLSLVEKDFVVSRLFQFIDVLMKQLIEYPESVASSLTAKVLACGEAGTAEARAAVAAKIKGDVENIISGAKNQIITELNGLKNKYQGNENNVDAIVQAVQEATLE